MAYDYKKHIPKRTVPGKHSSVKEMETALKRELRDNNDAREQLLTTGTKRAVERAFELLECKNPFIAKDMVKLFLAYGLGLPKATLEVKDERNKILAELLREADEKVVNPRPENGGDDAPEIIILES